MWHDNISDDNIERMFLQDGKGFTPTGRSYTLIPEGRYGSSQDTPNPFVIVDNQDSRGRAFRQIHDQDLSLTSQRHHRARLFMNNLG